MAVVVIDTIKPKNQGTFPVVEAADVKVTNDKRLDAALTDKADASTVAALSTAVAGKASQQDVTALQTAVAGKASQSDLTALSNTVADKADKSALAETNTAVAGKQAALSETQLAACNSGITSALVTQIGTNTTAIAGKADATDLAALESEVNDKADTADLTTATNNLQSQIDLIVTPVTQDAEVQNARVDSDGTTYNTLKARCDADDAKHATAEDIINDKISQISENEYVSLELTKTRGKLLVANGVVEDTATNYYYVSDLIDISDYPVVYVTAQSGYTNRLYALYDSNQDFVSDYSGEYASTKSITDMKVIVPSNVKYIRLSQWGNDSGEPEAVASMACKYIQYSVKGMSDVEQDISEINDDIVDINNNQAAYESINNDKFNQIADTEKEALEYTKTSNKLLVANGELENVETNYYYVSDYIDISDYPAVFVTAQSGYTNRLYALYDSSYNFVSDYAGEYAASKTITDKEVIVPSNVKYIRISQWGNVPLECKYNSYAVKGLSVLQADVSTLNTEYEAMTGTEEYNITLHPTSEYEFGYVTNSGYKNTETSDYVYTEKLPLESGDKVWITDSSGSPWLLRFVCAYNDDTVNTEAGATNVYEYTVPNNINGVICSIPSKNTSPSGKTIHVLHKVSGKVSTLNSSTDKLYGKKWCVIGDSFSYGGYTPMNVFESGRYYGYRKVYPYFIGNRTHINIVDFTMGGRTLAFPAEPGSFTNSITCPTAACYYQNIPNDVDYITIYLGINDSHHASGGGDGEDSTGYIPIGTVDDNTVNTFGGAWNVVLSWLIENRPNAHIGIIVSNGCDSDAYRTLTIAIAQKYGIPYIDLNGDQITPAMLRTTNPNIASSVKSKLIQKWSVDYPSNQHPTDAAHEFESQFIEEFLRRI